VKNKPVNRRGRTKRAMRREKRRAAWIVAQTLLGITKIILWICVSNDHR
jgi:hypothetical protein